MSDYDSIKLAKGYTGPGDLLPAEIFWRDNYTWLLSQGYALRNRYSPEWVPSWSGTRNGWWFSFEDGQAPHWTSVLDATRISDGQLVMLKRIRKSLHPFEPEMAQLHSRYPDRRNHCVPIIDTLHVPKDDDLDIIVMPYLIEQQFLPFETIGVAVECIRQVFEGVQFLHSYRIAHRNLKWKHILVDAAQLFSPSFHPVYPCFTRDFKADSHVASRTDYPVRYCITNFSQSKDYSSSDNFDYPSWNGDRTVPEFWSGLPCDVFAVDVYDLGSMIRNVFLKVDKRPHSKKGFEFLAELVDDMMHPNPSSRPTMDDVMFRFDVILKGLSPWTMRSRIETWDENPVVSAIRSMFHWFWQIPNILRRRPPLPVG